MRKKLRRSKPRPLHKNDVAGRHKLTKMLNRKKNRSDYAPPLSGKTGNYCYNRWAWLFRGLN